MTLDEGATFEINSRWPEYRQRNCALDKYMYGKTYYTNMVAGIKIIRDIHDDLKSSGAKTWTIDTKVSNLLDELSQKTPDIGFLEAQ
jgi:hypothetical protein